MESVGCAIKKKQRSEKPRWQMLKQIQVRRAMEAFQYLTTRRDWRYKTPWYLLMGEENCGKTTLIKSIKQGRRVQLLPQEEKLKSPGSSRHFFDHAVVIDAGDDLELIDVPLLSDEVCLDDNINLNENAISTTKTSFNSNTSSNPGTRSNEEETLDVASKTKKQTGFIIPVYLVVGQCDTVKGFNGFWQAQTQAAASRRHGMFGWS